MRLYPISVAIIAATLTLPAPAEIYLIAGSPAPKYNETFGVALLQVDEKGGVRTVAELVPPEVGAEWIAMSYEWRKAIIVPYSDSKPVLIVDFDKAAVVKKCKLPEVTGAALIGQWLASLPVRGPAFTWYVAGEDQGQKRLQGMVLDPSLACEHSFMTLDPSDVKYLVAHGTSGVVDVGNAEGTGVTTDDKGTLIKNVAGNFVPFDYAVPTALLEGFHQPYDEIVVNNPETLVLSMVGKSGPPRLLAYRKKDHTWHQIPAQLGVYGTVRGFGIYLAISEATSKGERAGNATPSGAVPKSANGVSIRESVGRTQWRTTPSRMGPSILGRFNKSEAVYSGRLHLYDLDTQQVYTIVTNQADSEILLVEDGTVYYRSSDRLYSATIANAGVGAPHLMAAAEEIRDVHWAFIKH